MRSNLAITVQVADGLVEGNMNDEKAVPLEGDYGLSLAMFRTMLGSPDCKTGRMAKVPLSGVVQRGVGQETSEVEDDKPPKTGDAVMVEDVPP